MKTRPISFPLAAALCAAALSASAGSDSAGEAAATTAPEAADLGTVLVEGSALSKYRPETVNGGTFTDLPPESLPLTVDTLTSDFIREHNPTDLHDLLRYVPGIETGGKSLLVRNPGQFSIRGMGGTEPAFDGVAPIGRGPGLFMDPFLLDRIEIVKGPVGSLSGGAGAVQNASGAGGAVNMYLKSAEPGEEFGEIRENNSFGKDTRRHRVMADGNEPVAGGDGAVRAVATADWYKPAYLSNGSQKGADARESYAVAPSAALDADEVRVGVKSLFQYTEQPSYIGVPVWRGRPGGGYGWFESSCRKDDRSGYKSFLVSPWADWEVRDGWTLKFGASAMASKWYQRTREPYTAMPGSPELAAYCRTGLWPSGEKYMTSGFSESESVLHNYSAFARSVAEAEFRDGSVSNAFLVQPDYNYRSASGGFGTPTSRFGATVQDTVTAGPLSVLAGVRGDRFEQSAYTSNGARYRHASANAVSPRGGVSLRPLDWIVLFGNVSQTRTPMLGLRCADGSTPDDPWRATQYEGGVRVRPREKLWLSLCGYRIDQEHVPEFDNSGLVADYDGRNASEGFETSLSGEITEDWTVLAMYSHNHYVDKNVPHGRKGRSFERYPADTVSLNTSYRVPGGRFEDTVIGFGLRFRSKSYATMRGAYVDENLRFDESCVFDLSAELPFSVAGGSRDWSLALGVRNLFDERYFESARHYYECLAGEPRTFEVGVHGTF